MIELRSDTFTRPSEAMRQAMYNAELGDDVYGEDPSINRLESYMAELAGAEAALFVPSGTMGNLIPLCVQVGRSEEVLIHEKAHILQHELGGIAAIAGALPISVPGERGILKSDAMGGIVKKSDYDIAHTKLIAIENTHNFMGGTCWSKNDFDDLQQFAQAEELGIHMDAARGFNASVASGISLAEMFSYCNSANFCLSKGLGAPVGSMIVGDRALIEASRRLRKMIGGGMRQAGVIAAAGLYALENNIDRLKEDHDHAKALAIALSESSWAELDPGLIESNIVFVQTPGRKASDITALLEEKGLRGIATDSHEIRFVTSLELSSDDCQKACDIFKTLY